MKESVTFNVWICAECRKENVGEDGVLCDRCARRERSKGWEILATVGLILLIILASLVMNLFVW